MIRRKLPIGIQTFSEMREGGYYYVDKTAIAQRMIDQGKYYFLSRPRRFGKSLFLDTLKELFEGNELLFKGLFIHDSWDWSSQHPIIRLSFGGGQFGSTQALQDSLKVQLDELEQAYQLPTSPYPDAPSRFRHLIKRLDQKTGRRVVVLVDEYDKPILDALEKPEVACDNRDTLRGFYSIIKDSDAHIRFAFLTGVSKFSKVSLFSGLNNLQDITLDERYSTICGYTDRDVDTVFAPELERLDREEIRRWYNGYNWLGESVYNPFDLLLLFSQRKFGAYWFETGTPTFLIKLLANRGYYTPDLAKTRSNLALLSTFDVDNIASEALLFQTGYLTIRAVQEPLPGQWVYTLGYPNKEVESSLNASLLGAYGSEEHQALEHRLRLLELLQANDFGGLRELFHAFYASIPHDWYRKNELARYEGYYASIFYSQFAALGLDIVVEDSSNKGRVDMTVKFNGHVYLFEFKVVELLPEGKAIEQLKARGYAAKYRMLGQPIHLIGVEFSRENRNIVGFEVEDA
jgi:hypothetical protein